MVLMVLQYLWKVIRSQREMSWGIQKTFWSDILWIHKWSLVNLILRNHKGVKFAGRVPNLVCIICCLHYDWIFFIHTLLLIWTLILLEKFSRSLHVTALVIRYLNLFVELGCLLRQRNTFIIVRTFPNEKVQGLSLHLLRLQKLSIILVVNLLAYFSHRILPLHLIYLFLELFVLIFLLTRLVNFKLREGNI